MLVSLIRGRARLPKWRVSKVLVLRKLSVPCVLVRIRRHGTSPSMK